MLSHEVLVIIEQEGRLAYYQGMKATDNPFLRDEESEQFMAWKKGFKAQNKATRREVPTHNGPKVVLFSDTVDSAIKNGAKAFKNGESYEDCPYLLNNSKQRKLHYAWKAGYNDAEMAQAS